MADDSTIGSVTWANVNNAKASDNSYSTADLSSAAVVLDSYSESNFSTYNPGIYGPSSGSHSIAGQTFRNVNQCVLDTCKFYGSKTAGLTGSAYALIYAITGTLGVNAKPTGSILATSDAFDVSTIVTYGNGNGLFTLTFSGANKITLSANTNYAIVLKFEGGSSGNAINLGIKYDSPTHQGNYTYLSNNNWNSADSWDCCFYVYGIEYKTSHYLKASNFGLTIPNGAKINGIKVEVEGKGSATDLVKENAIKIVKADGTIGTTNKSTSISLATSDAYVTYGGTADLWGETWTPTQINDVDFGVVYSVVGTGTGSIDHIRTTVYYDNVVNPTNAYASDNTYANLTGAVSGDLSVSISKDGGTNYSSPLTKTYTSSEGYQTFGNGSTELWGLSLNGDSVDDTDFRLKISHNGVSQIYKNFGIAIAAGTILTGLEIKVEAKYIVADTTIYIDNLQINAYYGTSTLPVQAGSMAFASNGRKDGQGAGAGTGVLAVFDGTNWTNPATGATITA